MPALNDAEGTRLPQTLPQVIDGHVHLFPPPLFRALWRWFDTHGWPIRYKLDSPAILDFLFDRGVEHVIALHYAHRPGIARGLNAYVARLAQQESRLTGLATVLPGEPDAPSILEEAFSQGLHGVKLHCHVQAFAIDSPELIELFEICVRWQRPMVIHAGREPRSPAYPVDTHSICHVDRVAAVLQAWPQLKLCVPHLGADEFDGYLRLLERHDNLWLDTTMMVADYFPGAQPSRFIQARPDRVLYGTDFPNLPYAWDREVSRLARLDISEQDLAQVLSLTARALFDL
jgi:predicted TIM-barrel fold metal-dependent hydrolase